MMPVVDDARRPQPGRAADIVLPRSVPAESRAASGQEQGFTIASAMWVMAVTLVLVTAFANLFVQRYAQAVIRQATDEGARAWAVNGGTAADCMAAANDVMGDLLGGSMASGVTFSCVDTGTSVTATATASLASLPPLPRAEFTTASVVTKELEDGLELP